MVRGQPVKKALHDLSFCPKKAAVPLKKLVASGVANAKHNHKVKDENSLLISEIRVDEAPTLKRWRFVSRGKVHRIRKRAAHVSLVISHQEPAVSQKPKAKS